MCIHCCHFALSYLKYLKYEPFSEISKSCKEIFNLLTSFGNVPAASTGIKSVDRNMTAAKTFPECLYKFSCKYVNKNNF